MTATTATKMESRSSNTHPTVISAPLEPPPSNDSGTAITRTLLSALPLTSSDDEGLNRSAVGGSSCALRIETCG